MVLYTDYQNWVLAPEQSYTMGRAVANREPSPTHLEVVGNPHISRLHFRVQATGTEVWVEVLPSGKNPVFYQGDHSDNFRLKPGDSFHTCGTIFRVAKSLEDVSAADQPTPAVTTEVKTVPLQNIRGKALENCFFAIVELIPELRKATGEPWQKSCDILYTVLDRGDALPESVLLVEVTADGRFLNLARRERYTEARSTASERLVNHCLDSGRSVTYLVESPDSSPYTLVKDESWMVATPVPCSQGQALALYATGSRKSELDQSSLEGLAALLDIVAQSLAHHVSVQEAGRLDGELKAAKAAEESFSNLLGVFGHHVGTLFKTSGALTVWSKEPPGSPIKKVLDRLLPIWGISQAVSLHKKQSEKAWAQLLQDWVDGSRFESDSFLAEMTRSVEAMIAFVFYQGADDKPFLPWVIEGRELAWPTEEQVGLVTLPPFRDNELLFDRTLAVTLGLFEMLANLRAYPSSRGAGREDREDLASLPEEQRRVSFRILNSHGSLTLEVNQPLVVSDDGRIPQSRSLERISGLERTLLRGVVETFPMVPGDSTALPFITRASQKWVFNWQKLKEEFESTCG